MIDIKLYLALGWVYHNAVYDSALPCSWISLPPIHCIVVCSEWWMVGAALVIIIEPLLSYSLAYAGAAMLFVIIKVIIYASLYQLWSLCVHAEWPHLLLSGHGTRLPGREQGWRHHQHNMGDDWLRHHAGACANAVWLIGSLCVFLISPILSAAFQWVIKLFCAVQVVSSLLESLEG